MDLDLIFFWRYLYEIVAQITLRVCEGNQESFENDFFRFEAAVDVIDCALYRSICIFYFTRAHVKVESGLSNRIRIQNQIAFDFPEE